MKPEKMTAEELEQALMLVANRAGLPAVAERLRAHIAALTAERDEVVRALSAPAGAEWMALQRYLGFPDDGMERGVLDVRDAAHTLRERVQALEKQTAHVEAVAKGADLNWLKACERADTAESRIAAIRQRAGNAPGLVAEAHRPSVRVAIRYLLSEDATEEPDLSRLLIGPDAPIDGIPAPEPATAEAFATVRDGIGNATLSQADDARASLALLERRTGAMGRALSDAATFLEAEKYPVTAKKLRAALTDAPPVFTLEEVDMALAAAQSEDGDSFLAVADGVRRRLAALRKG